MKITVRKRETVVVKEEKDFDFPLFLRSKNSDLEEDFQEIAIFCNEDATMFNVVEVTLHNETFNVNFRGVDIVDLEYYLANDNYVVSNDESSFIMAFKAAQHLTNDVNTFLIINYGKNY